MNMKSDSFCLLGVIAGLERKSSLHRFIELPTRPDPQSMLYFIRSLMSMTFKNINQHVTSEQVTIIL